MESIAIIGLGCRFPGSPDPESFWQLLRSGKSSITEVPQDRWDINKFYDSERGKVGKSVSRRGGFLDKIFDFDANFFDISQDEAPRIDPHHRLILEVTWEALEHAGILANHLAGGNIGVFVGMSQSDHNRKIYENIEAIDSWDPVNTSLFLTANRLSYFLDLQGPSLTVDSACSSSLLAVHLACQSLRSGESSLVIAGGVSLRLSPEESIALSKKGMLSAQDQCKVFDADADGYVRGEGCGVLILKRLSDALQDQDNILAVIKGSAVNQNGHTQGMTAPNGIAQRKLLQQALKSAQVEAQKISYVETYSTGSVLADAVEFKALKSVLMDERTLNNPCWLSSVKTNIGHLEAASGMASLIKVILSMQHKEIPATLHLKKLNPLISLQETSFSIPTEVQPWNITGSRIAGISSSGIGGTNCHIILEEAPQNLNLMCEQEDNSAHIFTISAKTSEALHELAERYSKWIDKHNNISLSDLCFSVNVKRVHFDFRYAVVVKSLDELHQNLRDIVSKKNLTNIVSIESSNSRQISKLNEKIKELISNNPYKVKDKSQKFLILNSLVSFYIKGAIINWNDFYDAFYENILFQYNPLPTYPFQKKCYKLDNKKLKHDSKLLSENLLESLNIKSTNTHKNKIDKKDEITFIKLGDAPRNLTEKMLVSIWSDILSIEESFSLNAKQVNIFDNFFDLGGDSISISHLILKIQQVFEIDLPINILLDNLTIAKLSNIIEIEKSKEEKYKFTENSNFSLIQIQSGIKKNPIFLMPGGLGDVSFLMLHSRFAYFLGHEQPIYGFQLNNWNYPTVEVMASDYIAAILPLQPSGPYFLVGTCIGGITAFEMAQQLQSKGESVHLFLLDTPSNKISRVFTYIEAQISFYISPTFRLIYHLRQLRVIDLWKNKVSLIKVIKSKLRERAELSGFSRNKFNKFDFFKAILINYKINPYEGNIVLFVANKSIISKLSVLGWKSVALKGIDIYKFSCFHISILSKYAPDISRKMREIINHRQ